MNRFCLSLLFVFSLALSSQAVDTVKLTIGVTPFPHKGIMLIVKNLLAKEGIALTIVEFNDYVQPNVALAEKSLDANFFQHIPYLDNINAEKKLDLVWVAKVHIEPLGLYSKKIKELNELKKNDIIALPDDPTNEARALRLLEKGGLIQVKPGELVTIRDITRNPRGLNFVAIEASQLPYILQDVRAAVINTNFAFEAELVPPRDALIMEDKNSPYANVVVVRKADVNKPAIKALAKASNSPEVKAYIREELEPKGMPKGIVPAF
jgi:D-methionine transport system substrate-binding protein